MRCLRPNVMGPELVLLVLLACLAGAAIGTFTGLVPGIHVNTLASILLLAYPAMDSALSSMIEGSYVPLIVSSCIMSASVVHSFVDFVPSVFIGAPDPDEVLSTLPGHKLMMQGQGMRAVRSAAIGSAVGAGSAILLALPLQYLMLNGLAERLELYTTSVLLFTLIVIILTQRNWKGAVWATILVGLSGTLGMIFMDPSIPSSGILGDSTLLFPMLTGLFGIPVLLSSFNNSSVPEQVDDDPFPVGAMPGIKGVLTGSLAGWYPGITATAGASLSSAFMPEDRPERFISLVASIGTVTSIFSLITLSVSGSGRSGTVIVIREIIGDDVSGFGSPEFLLLLLCSAVASFLGYHITIKAGKMMSRLVNGIDTRRMNKVVVVLIFILVILMTGPVGVLVLIISTFVGLIPLEIDMSRIPLTGCLIVPVVINGLSMPFF